MSLCASPFYFGQQLMKKNVVSRKEQLSVGFDTWLCNAVSLPG
jgi:hypothetical protein